jgi:hypothetical protein
VGERIAEAEFKSWAGYYKVFGKQDIELSVDIKTAADLTSNPILQ